MITLRGMSAIPKNTNHRKNASFHKKEVLTNVLALAPTPTSTSNIVSMSKNVLKFFNATKPSSQTTSSKVSATELISVNKSVPLQYSGSSQHQNTYSRKRNHKTYDVLGENIKTLFNSCERLLLGTLISGNKKQQNIRPQYRTLF